MINLGIFKTQRIVDDQYEDIYNLTLDKKDQYNVVKNVMMPISMMSETGLYLTSLINQVEVYIPDAAPDPLSQAKATKLQLINSQWTVLEKTGWDSGQGFNLGIASSDVALLVGVFSLAKEAAAMGLAVPSIIAMNNSVVNFETISEMTVLLLRYGAARSQMSEDFAAKRRAVESSTTVEELELIQ